MVPAAHGNDGGGSLRIPASCCGLFGLKPTRGRNPHGPDYGDLLGGLAVEHAVTRSVRDSALLLDVTAGPSPGDPYCAPPKERPYLEETERGPGTLRIGFTARAPFDFPVHPDCRAAVEDAAGLLAEMGHRVEEARPDYDDGELGRAFSVLWSAGCGWAVEYWRRAAAKPAPAAEHFEPFTWAMYKRGLSRTAPEYMLALTAVQRQSRRIAEFFDRFDLLLTPTLAEPPLPLGSLDPAPNDPMTGAHRAAGWACFTSLANAAGIPAMSAPLYWTASGLPVGVQFAAPFGGEDRLFRLAARLEEARPWRGRRPPVFAD
jgi:amidase